MLKNVSSRKSKPALILQLNFRYCSAKLFLLPHHFSFCILRNQTFSQVVTGGHYDIDFELIAPNKEILYREVKKQYDSFSKKADITGVYAACFSNEFSTFSHKLVYVDWQVGAEDPLPGVGETFTAMTQVY